MKHFSYIAYDKVGNKLVGELSSVDEEGARAELKEKKLILVSITEDNIGNGIARSDIKLNATSKELLITELATLLNSGISLVRSLELVGMAFKDKSELYLLSSDLKTNVEKGLSFSECLLRHPQTFEPLLVNLVKVSESTGEMPAIFASLAESVKFQNGVKQKIVQALIYPSIILFVCVSAIVFVFNFVVPNLASLFEQQETIPIYTEIMLSVGDFFINYQLYMLAAIIVLAVYVYTILQDIKKKSKFYALVAKLPLIKYLYRSIQRMQFSVAMKLTLHSGIPLDKALLLSLENVNDLSMKRLLMTIEKSVKSGQSLASAMQTTNLFPPMYIGLVEVGEETGKLDEVFAELSNRARDNFESWITKLTSLIEPILILLMGGIVGSVVVVMLLSIVSIQDVSF